MSTLARIFLSLIITCSQPSTGLLAIGIQLATVGISQNSLSLTIVHLLNYHKMTPYGFNKGNRRACLCFDTQLALFYFCGILRETKLLRRLSTVAQMPNSSFAICSLWLTHSCSCQIRLRQEFETSPSIGFNKAKLIACLYFHTRLTLS